MNVDLGIWSKLTRVVIFLLVAAGLVGIGVWYLPLIRQNEHYGKEVIRLDKLIQKEEESAKQSKASSDALRNDPKAVERLAREMLLYARSNETVIIFENAATNRARPR
jgi:hypothetical protein